MRVDYSLQKPWRKKSLPRSMPAPMLLAQVPALQWGKEVKMPDLPKKKVGIVACSGEETAEGTVTRLAALRVLEQLRPNETVTICLPLFLAGGEGDRAFARFYLTIATSAARRAARKCIAANRRPASSSQMSSKRTILARRGD